MKAAVLKALGSPLAVETVPDPVLGTGEVIVDVAATKVLAYAGEVFSGKRRYLLEPPVIPGAGCIGRVRQVGPDATELAAGDWVFCDPTVRSRDNAQAPDIILQGLTAGSERAKRLQKYFHDGSWAERTRVPTECAVRIGPLGDAEAVSWCAFGNFVVPYGGYVAANLRPGETVLVNGATGAFGSGGVAVALAMGASSGDRHGPQPAGSRRSRAPLWRARAARAHGRRRGAGPQSHPGGGGGADRLRARPAAARGDAEPGARRLAHRAAVRAGGADGRRRPGRRGPVLLADAQLRDHPRPVDVCARIRSPG